MKNRKKSAQWGRKWINWDGESCMSVCLEEDKWKKTKHMISSSLLAGASYFCWPSCPWNARLGLRAEGNGEYGEKGQRRTLGEGDSHRRGKERKDGKAYHGGREIKAWKGGLAQGWDKSGKLSFWREQRRNSNVWENKQKSQCSLVAAPLHNPGWNQDPEPLLPLHQQIPVNIFKPLNAVVMKSPYRKEDLCLHIKVWIMQSKKGLQL